MFRDQLLLHPEAVRRCEPGLIDVFLDCHGHARKRSRITSRRNGGVHRVGGLQGGLVHPRRHRVDLRIHCFDAGDDRFRHRPCGHVAGLHPPRRLRPGQTPKIGHDSASRILSTQARTGSIDPSAMGS